MDLDRAWTAFALDAEVEAYGTARIAASHNALREENARLKAPCPLHGGSTDISHDCADEIRARLSTQRDEIRRLTALNDVAERKLGEIRDTLAALTSERDEARAELERLKGSMERCDLAQHRHHEQLLKERDKARRERDEARARLARCVEALENLYGREEFDGPCASCDLGHAKGGRHRCPRCLIRAALAAAKGGE